MRALNMGALERPCAPQRRRDGATRVHDIGGMRHVRRGTWVRLRICPTRHGTTPWCSHAPELLVQVGTAALWCWMRSVSACCVYFHAYGAPLDRGMWGGARHG